MIKKNEQKKNYCWIGVCLIIITILIVGGIIYYKMPKKVCHDEYEIHKINLPSIQGMYLWIEPCEYYTGEITCENGVTDYSSLRKVCNWDSDESKICLEKTTKEVCEVVYK